MNWEALGAIAELLAALGVIISLIYLAVQIRHGSASVRATMFLTSSTNQSELTSYIFQDSEMARIFRVGQRDIGSLTEDEQTRFVSFFASLFRTYEQMFQQDRMGLLDPEIWEARREAMIRAFRQPGVQSMWRMRRHAFSRSFRDFLDAAQEELKLADARQAAEPQRSQIAED
jgi:hypothetical protein